MTLVVNGRTHDLPPGTTVVELVRDLGSDPAGAGMAVAVNGTVVPRHRWAERELAAGDRVEVLAAVQGG